MASWHTAFLMCTWHPNLRVREIDLNVNTNNLAVCNPGNTPTYVNNYLNDIRSSIIDLTLVSNTIHDKFIDWRVDTEEPQPQTMMLSNSH